MKTCPKCGTEHDKPGTFCSRTCANSRVRTDDLKRQVSHALAGRVGKNANKGKQLVERLTKNCETCGSLFSFTPSQYKKFCNKDCWKKQAGGYREGSGRAKTGYYKGIYCGSTYELCWVIYSLDHGVDFIRFPGKLSLNGITYYPDFLLGDNKTIVETKGYESNDSVSKKTEVAELLGYNVVVLRKNDLAHIFEYVQVTYGTKKYHLLYDKMK
jgi:hypothetical protein